MVSSCGSSTANPMPLGLEVTESLFTRLPQCQAAKIQQISSTCSQGVYFLAIKFRKSISKQVPLFCYKIPVSYTHLDVYKRQIWNHTKFGDMDPVAASQVLKMVCVGT